METPEPSWKLVLAAVTTVVIVTAVTCVAWVKLKKNRKTLPHIPVEQQADGVDHLDAIGVETAEHGGKDSSVDSVKISIDDLVKQEGKPFVVHCARCGKSIDTEEELMRLKCGHVFHLECFLEGEQEKTAIRPQANPGTGGICPGCKKAGQ